VKEDAIFKGLREYASRKSKRRNWPRLDKEIHEEDETKKII
jgi:hypothetical protein